MSKESIICEGGALYGYHEILEVVTRINYIKTEYNKANTISEKYAEDKWKETSTLKKIWCWINSPSIYPNLKSKWYVSSFYEVSGTFPLAGLNCRLSGIFICKEYKIAQQLISLEKAKRSCYLTPDQIKLISDVNSYYKKEYDNV